MIATKRPQASTMSTAEAKAFAAKNAALKAYCSARTEQESERAIAAFQEAYEALRSLQRGSLGFKTEVTS